MLFASPKTLLFNIGPVELRPVDEEARLLRLTHKDFRVRRKPCVQGAGPRLHRADDEQVWSTRAVHWTAEKCHPLGLPLSLQNQACVSRFTHWKVRQLLRD